MSAIRSSRRCRPSCVRCQAGPRLRMTSVRQRGGTVSA